MCGGASSSNSITDCYEYSSNSWTRTPSMATGRYWFDMIYLKQKIYAVGGTGASGSENSMEIFKSSTRTWSKQLLPFSIYSHCITQLSADQFILIGGWDHKNGGVSKSETTKNILILRFYFLHLLHKIFVQTLFIYYRV